jgi:hypothetical protein
MKSIFIMAALAVSSTAFAGQVVISNQGLGSGTPAQAFTNATVENAAPVVSNEPFLHAPQYLPYYPTAAVIWPRAIEVPCTKVGANDLLCDDYYWTPAMGRGEYLFFTPVVKEAPKPVIVKETVVIPGPERIILKEVPVKPKKE